MEVRIAMNILILVVIMELSLEGTAPKLANEDENTEHTITGKSKYFDQLEY
jgi:hypothetical protein